MPITRHKKDFLCHISGGIDVIMTREWLSDSIYAGQVEEIEVFIKKNFLEGPVSPEDEFCRPSFSEDKFREAMKTIDDETLVNMLKYFDERGLSMSEAYAESCMIPSDFPSELTDIAETLGQARDREIITFEHFLQI